jgi:Zn-dependent M28 family amino/carboxypeptidase
MKKRNAFSFFLAAGFFASVSCTAQKAADVISVAEVRRIESILASDSFGGRAVGTPGIRMAADFIAAEFKKAGLQPLQGGSFLQEFVMVKPLLKELKFKAEGTDIDGKGVIVFTTKEELEVTEKSGYEVAAIAKGDRVAAKVMQFLQAKKNMIVLVDTSFSANFSGLNRFKRQQFKTPYSVVFLLGNSIPKEFKIKANHTLEETKLANVVGVLPGRSKKEEQVIFSAHYDHIGIGRPVAGDSIYNGANDDAAGTTAVILLANHFKRIGGNERTLIFSAFTAEESGGFGAQYFSQQLAPEKIAAMFNIEMIGTESKWGRNSAYITGYEKSSMGEILQASLKGSGFTFHPDPYPQEQLFYRSDNATLARLGVPAHTISTAKMEGEPNYHKPSDEVSTLDLENMAQIIKAIAESSKTIVSGKETPTRVKEESLRPGM